MHAISLSAAFSFAFSSFRLAFRSMPLEDFEMLVLVLHRDPRSQPLIRVFRDCGLSLPITSATVRALAATEFASLDPAEADGRRELHTCPACHNLIEADWFAGRSRSLTVGLDEVREFATVLLAAVRNRLDDEAFESYVGSLRDESTTRELLEILRPHMLPVRGSLLEPVAQGCFAALKPSV